MTTEYEVLLERLKNNCDLLALGWDEMVTYKVTQKIHQSTDHIGKECDCPTGQKERVKYVRRPGLLDQLREYQRNKDVDRNPKAARGAPRVKTPKTHPELAGFLTLDEITCDAYSKLDRIFEEAGRDRMYFVDRNFHSVINGLPYQVQQYIEARPDLARETLKLSERWVRQAKATLKMTVDDAMFEGVVCENCGGALAVAWDNQSDVRCIGSPADPPCGHTYPMSEWVALYERGKRDS